MLTLKALRFSHLLLALAASAAYLTGEAGGGIHKLIGYTVAALLIIRLLLSLFGGGVFGFSRWIPRVQAPANQRGLRHPAISRLLVLGILTCAVGAATTGVLMDQGRALANPQFTLGEGEEGEEGEGGRGGEGGDEGEDEALRPANPSVRPVIAAGFVANSHSGRREQRERDEEEGPLGELHELFANLLLPLVGVHVAYLMLFRLPLAQFMLFWPKRKSVA